MQSFRPIPQLITITQAPIPELQYGPVRPVLKMMRQVMLGTDDPSIIVDCDGELTIIFVWCAQIVSLDIVVKH